MKSPKGEGPDGKQGQGARGERKTYTVQRRVKSEGKDWRGRRIVLGQGVSEAMWGRTGKDVTCGIA